MAKGTMPKPPKPRKPKKCPICKSEFTPWSTTQKTCPDWQCGLAFSRQQKADKEAREARVREKAERADIRERKAALKPIRHWEDLTQTPCNAFIVARDRDLPCISCGTWDTVQWQAGHYRSRGKASHLRYDPDNIHKQCHHCNVALSGNQIQYRIRLVHKIGISRVEALENSNEPRRFTREELQAIRAGYRAKLRELLKQQGAE